MKLAKVVEGVHKKQTFRFENGKLFMFSKHWDREDIAILVETANLLSLEGYNLKVPTGTHKRISEGVFGGMYEVEEKTYDEGENK